jgi:glycosyltransferase involved in cell wall biosynthesis
MSFRDHGPKAEPTPVAEKMRVLIAQLATGFAGTERHAVELANGLAPYAEVAMLLRERPKEPHRHAEYTAMRAALNPSIPVFFSSRGMQPFGIWRALRCFRPQLIHAHHENSVRMATRWARPFGVPVIGTIHVTYRARDFARCKALIALTEAERERAAREYAREIAVIENWTLPHPPPTATRLQALREEFGLNEGDLVFGTVGRLDPVKRIDGLIAAFVAADIPHSKLLIVGDGPARADLEAAAAVSRSASDIRFVGFRQDVKDFYPLFSTFILNSATEPFGLALLEAAASCPALIATATAGPLSIAKTVPMTLVDPSRPEELVAALRAPRRRLCSPPDLGRFHFAARIPVLLDLYRRTVYSGHK